MKRIRWLMFKEFLQVRRDRRLIGILIIAPVIQLVILGFAATTDVREVIVAVRDHDGTFHSREYVRAIGASNYLKPVMLEGPESGDASWLVSGRAGLVLVIPKGFGTRLATPQMAPVQVLVDGSDSNYAVQGLNYLLKATRLYSERLVKGQVIEVLRRRNQPLPTITAQTRIWYNPGLLSSNYMLPAIMGVLLLVTTTLVTSMALVREKEDGTLEQLLITPLRPLEIVIGKLLPFAVIGLVEMTLALAVVTLLFGLPLKGGLLDLYGVSILFLFSTLGMGLLISTLVHTQQQAMLIAGFGIMMPYTLLSGFIFPIENMPAAIQPVTYLIPLRYYLDLVRSLFLKGIPAIELWPDIAGLILCGAVILALAVVNFHKRLD